MTDPYRQTGRTTRMLEEAVAYKETAAVRIVVHNYEMGRYCLHLAPTLRPNDFVVLSRGIDRALRGIRLRSQVFVDHAVWELSPERDIVRLEAALRLMEARP